MVISYGKIVQFQLSCQSWSLIEEAQESSLTNVFSFIAAEVARGMYT